MSLRSFTIEISPFYLNCTFEDIVTPKAATTQPKTKGRPRSTPAKTDDTDIN